METTSFPLTWLDTLVLLPLLYGLIRGAIRGCFSELIGIAAIILGIVGVRMFGTGISSWLIAKFAWPEMVCRIVSAVCLILVIAIALTIIGSLLTKLFKSIHLGWFNRFTGAIIGAAKWGVVTIILVFALNFLDEHFSLLPPELKTSSPVYSTFLDWAQLAWNHLFPNINANQ